jgi:hypothetical protein
VAGTAKPMDILSEWRAFRLAAGRPTCGLLVGQAVDDYLKGQEKRIATGNLGQDTMRQKRVKLLRFRSEFALRNLAEVTQKEIDAWLEKIAEKVGAAPATVNDHLKKVRGNRQVRNGTGKGFHHSSLGLFHRIPQWNMGVAILPK